MPGQVSRSHDIMFGITRVEYRTDHIARGVASFTLCCMCKVSLLFSAVRCKVHPPQRPTLGVIGLAGLLYPASAVPFCMSRSRELMFATSRNLWWIESCEAQPKTVKDFNTVKCTCTRRLFTVLKSLTTSAEDSKRRSDCKRRCLLSTLVNLQHSR